MNAKVISAFAAGTVVGGAVALTGVAYGSLVVVGKLLEMKPVHDAAVEVISDTTEKVVFGDTPPRRPSRPIPPYSTLN